MIRARLNYRTQHSHKLEAFILKLCESLSLQIDQLKIEKYWKVEGQFQASFLITNAFDNDEQLVFNMLRIVNALKKGKEEIITVNGPSYLGAQINFECFLNGMEDSNLLQWLHLEIELDA